VGMAAREPRCANTGQQGDQTGEVFTAGRTATVLQGPRRRTQQRHPRLHLPEPLHGGTPLECRGHELAADQFQSCRLEHPRGPGEGGRDAHCRIAAGSFGDTETAKADGHQRMGVPWNRCHGTPGGTQEVLASRP